MTDMTANPADVRHAYRLLLGREPDREGLENYCKMVAARSIRAADLAQIFIGSSEYRARTANRREALEVDFEGYCMYVHPDDLDIGANVSAGRYEPHVTAAVKELLYPGATFVDVGANIGYFAALGAHLVGPDGRVVAVEPMDKNLQLIYMTIWKNRFTQIEVMSCAASSSAQIVPMATTSASSNGEVLRADSQRKPSLFAQTRRLDDLLRDIDRIDLIKLDIEGHELPAWRGFSEGMARCRPLVLTEFHPKCMRENAGIEPADYLALLFDYGSSIEVLRGPQQRVTCHSPADVMSEWQATDQRLQTNGKAHLDLFIKPD